MGSVKDIDCDGGFKGGAAGQVSPMIPVLALGSSRGNRVKYLTRKYELICCGHVGKLATAPSNG